MNVVSLSKPARKPQARSRVTNGSALGEMDGRSKWARRMRDLIDSYSSDVSDDPDTIPHSTRSIIRRAAKLTVELEQAETSFAIAGKATADELRDYQTTANTLRRLIDGMPLKLSIREAREIDKALANAEAVKMVTMNWGRDEHALCVGEKNAKYELARAIAFMIEKARRENGPLPEAIAKLAEELALAVRAEEPKAGTANDNDEVVL